MGVVSNGMLCSGDELNLTADADGILILPPGTPLGRPLVELYGDVVLDVDVKPNRGDALSLVGLAREVAAVTGAQVRFPDTDPPESGDPVERFVDVEVRDTALCPRFVGRWVGGVTIGPSPDRVQMRLRAAGMRPISNVVDASNYVMLELGKPIHTFDAAGSRPSPTAGTGSIVRRARAGRAARDARPRRADARPGHAPHRRRPRPARHRRRSWAARRPRSATATTRRHRRVGDLRPGDDPPDRPALRPPLARRASGSRRARSSGSPGSGPTGRRG